MQKDQQQELLQRKAVMQDKLAVKNFITTQILDWLPVYDYLLAHHIRHTLRYLTCTNQQLQPYWEASLAQLPLEPYGFNTSQLYNGEVYTILEKTDRLFPNTYPLRYVPDLPVLTDELIPPAVALAQAVDHLQLPDGEVYLFYQRFSPLLTIQLSDLIRHADELINSWYADTSICAADGSWMIFYSIEDIWYSGYPAATDKHP
ncbi:hypothetical protein [Chitinophaga sp. MM2321]|uniref:hypothetical protein n=1 Tax=Chitinophaga sp. MM2321 TaxID=3137178 RepID=UPI0032D57618